MCGVAGKFQWGASASEGETRMCAALDALARRGPNDRGLEAASVANGAVFFGHTRLSVIDLTNAAHQPMHSASGRYLIVFNGEIYNYRELRAELSAQGVRFFSESDTEVLLAAWSHWGHDVLPRLIGMFAFAVLDRQNQTLTCIRDPFGIKPLYFSIEGRDFVFASELPAVALLKKQRPALNLQRTYDYLVQGEYDSNDSTFLEGVHHLMPGHWLQANLVDGSIKLERWWQPKLVPELKISLPEAAEVLRTKFLHSVRLNLRSDVPLGAALSGGLDSSTIVCAMRHLEPDMPLHTFSFIATESSVSEEVWVDQVNTHTTAIGHKIEVHPEDLVGDLDDMIASQGEPFGSTSIYAQYRVYKLAREHGITVTLDGQGADELLGGYVGYPGQRVHSLLDQRRYLDSIRFLHQWGKWPGRSWQDGLKATIAECVDGKLYEYLRQANGAQLRPDWLDTNALQDAGVQLRFAYEKPQPNWPGRRLSSALGQSLTRCGLPALLRHGDRNSMRFSVESRVPFLSTDLTDFLLTLPEHYLVSDAGETKHVFRMAMRGIVPDAILNRRDKVGFATPEYDWLKQLAPQVREWLCEDLGLPFLRTDAILREYDAVMAGVKPFTWQIWRFINFKRWYSRVFQALGH